MSLESLRGLPWFCLHDHAIPLPESFAAKLGEIVVQWGAFENDIARDMTLLMRFPIAAALASEPIRAFGPRITLWRRAIRALFPEIPIYQTIANGVAKEGRSLAKRRNHLVHGQWRTNTDPDDPRWIVFIEGGYTASNISGFYVGEEQVSALAARIRALRLQFVGFVVNRHWHARLGILAESHAPTLDNPARLILQSAEWPLSKVDLLDPTVPEQLAKTFLFRD